MASSASSSSAVGSGKSRNSSVSDLLINFRGDFAEWLPAVQKKAIETLEKKCKREVLGAQVLESSIFGVALFYVDSG